MLKDVWTPSLFKADLVFGDAVLASAHSGYCSSIPVVFSTFEQG